MHYQREPCKRALQAKAAFNLPITMAAKVTTGSVMRWSQNEWKENWLVVDGSSIRVYRSEQNYTSGEHRPRIQMDIMTSGARPLVCGVCGGLVLSTRAAVRRTRAVGCGVRLSDRRCAPPCPRSHQGGPGFYPPIHHRRRHHAGLLPLC